MTDFEPYVAEPSEPRPRPPLAGLRPLLAWFAAVLVIVALAYTWLQGAGAEDPSLNVPVDELTTPPAEPPPGDPAATAEPPPPS